MSIIELLGPREVIGEAIAVLRSTQDVSRDAAFEMLVHESSRLRRTVRDVAAEIVGGAANSLEPPESEAVRSRATGAEVDQALVGTARFQSHVGGR